MTPLLTFAVIALTVTAASVLSARITVAAALVELALGVVAGAVLPLDAGAPWLALLASIGGVALTFVAGSDIDVDAVRRAPGPALALGSAAFAAPFVVTVLAAHAVLGWSWTAAIVAGAVLGETSLAVTYSVLLELRLVSSELGRLLMAAVFVTDVAAAAVMTAVVSRPSWGLLGFAAGSAVVCAALPGLLRLARRVTGDRPSEPGLRLVVLALAGLLALAQAGGGVAVLPAFVLGVVCSRYYREHPAELSRLRTLVMGFLAPFVFVRAGISVSVPAVLAGAPVVGLLLLAKVAPKAFAARAVLDRIPLPVNGSARRGGAALMATGLTFGTVINLAAYQAHLLDRSQFSVLAATVLLSAVLPGTVAQRLLGRGRTIAVASTAPAPRPAPDDATVPAGRLAAASPVRGKSRDDGTVSLLG